MCIRDRFRIISNLFLILSINFIGTLELMLLKYTEYEILSFLRYDNLFRSMMKDKASKQIDQTKIRVQQIGASNIKTPFNVAIINLDRLFDLYTMAAVAVRQKSKFNQEPAQSSRISPKKRNVVRIKSKRSMKRF